MYKNRPSVPSPSLVVVSERVLSVSLELYVSGIHSTRNNLHRLLSFVGRVAARASLIIFIVQDDNLTKGVFDLITLLTSLISPLLEFGERDMLNLLPCFHPCASLEHSVIIGVGVTNMRNNSKLDPASQRKFLCITYSICALPNVSIHSTYQDDVSTSSKA